MLKYLKTNWIPIVSAIILFFILSAAYFTPAIQGKVLTQHDKVVFQGSAKESKDFKEKTGENTLWTNSMFSGMPTYLINNLSEGNRLLIFHRVLLLNNKIRPIPFLFLFFLGFFIALLAFRINPWLSIVGSFSFALSTYLFLIIFAGHITKAIAIGYMAPIIAGVYLAYNKKELWGTVLMAFFLSFQLIANHLQITYYTFLIILIFVIFQIINSIKERAIRAFIKSSSYLLVGAILAVGSNFLSISAVYDYSQDSIRGASELTSEQSNRTSGLDKDYATDWSYGIFESLNMLIPDLMGGSSQSDLGTKSETYDALKRLGQPNAKQIVKQMPTYWGDQPGTGGPTYIGAIVIFLFVLALFLVKGQVKWWLLTATVLSIMLAWGKNMMWLTDFFLDYFPGYNKFRAVSMTLIMAELTIPLLGILGLQKLISGDYDKQKIKKYLLYTLGITGGTILILLVGLPNSSTAFVGANDTAMFGQNELLLDAIRADRASMFKTDALRSLFFILLTAVSIFLLTTNKIKRNAFFIILGLALIADFWPVAKRYLNDSHFTRESKAQAQFKPSVADQSILSDTDPNYRVLNLSVSTFNDASTSYFHKSIGGYHGAKMRRYQELITHYMAPEIQQFLAALRNSSTPQSVQQALQTLKTVSMLNAKYIIYNPQAPAIPNNYALGNAWFVENAKLVANADEEIAALKDIRPSKTALVDKRFENELFDFSKDPNASINLEEYQPNYLKYSSNCTTDQLAVFSEVYYSKGWKAFIDGKEVPHFRANYILRAMKVPSGSHTIEFRFAPEVYTTGMLISLISSILMLLLLASGFWYDSIQKKKQIAKE